MGLTPSVPRTLFHEREVRCLGYRRDDGLWDIEGRIIDTKTYPLTFYNGRSLEPGQPLHEMHLRLTIDDALVIHAAEASTVHSPHPPCPEIVTAYQQLVGLKIGPGFSSRVRELFKGRGGCTHLTELLGPLATTALQTVTSGVRRLAAALPGEQACEKMKVMESEFAGLIDTCHGWRSDGEPVSVRFPDRYTGPQRPVMPDLTGDG